MTYNEAYNKIIDAYFKDEIRPYDASFCFCGTLAGGYTWDKYYSWSEYREMEKALLGEIYNNMKEYFPEMSFFAEHQKNPNLTNSLRYGIKTHPNYENAIFNAMAKSLDILKQIHIDRGEIIDEPIQFKKRQLLQI